MQYRAHLLNNLGQEAEAILDINQANYLIAREISSNPYGISLEENDNVTQKTLIQCRVESLQALIKVQERAIEFNKLKDEIQRLKYESLIFEQIEAKEEIVKKKHWQILQRAADYLFDYKEKPNKAILQIKKEAYEHQKAIIDIISQLRLSL